MAALFDTTLKNKKTSHEIHISHMEKQLHNGQDYITSGDNFIWGFDGHANDYIINKILKMTHCSLVNLCFCPMYKSDGKMHDFDGI